MTTVIKFTARDLIVDGKPAPRHYDVKADKQVVASAIKTALFPKKVK